MQSANAAPAPKKINPMQPANAAPAPKKRRLVPTPTAVVAATPPPQLELKPTVELSASEGVSTTFGLPHAAVESVASAEQLCSLLQREAEHALQTHEQWARSPHAAWVQELGAELTDAEARPALLGKQRRLQGVADDFAARWEAGAELASKVVDLWLEDKTLEQVLAKSASLGHDRLRSGVVLSGRFVRETAAKQNISVEQLVPWVSSLASTPAGRRAQADTTASLYRTDPANSFLALADEKCSTGTLVAELRERLATGAACGSLNTTRLYDEEEDDDDANGAGNGGGATRPSGVPGVPLLDGYWEKLDGAFYGVDRSSVRLNPRLFLIWKLPGYATAHHQDVHIQPHLTLYNQTSGASTFHFLPLLVGLFVTHVGRTKGPHALAAVLATLEREGVGETATLGPGQMLLLLPAGAHGVFVPRPSANPTLSPFELSVIRAAEVLIWPVYSLYERRYLSAAAWSEPPFALTEAERHAEAAQSRAFEERQESVCAELGLARDEWFTLARRLWAKWEGGSSNK